MLCTPAIALFRPTARRNCVHAQPPRASLQRSGTQGPGVMFGAQNAPSLQSRKQGAPGPGSGAQTNVELPGDVGMHVPFGPHSFPSLQVPPAGTMGAQTAVVKLQKRPVTHTESFVQA